MQQGRILIVDDEPKIRSFIGRALAAVGYATEFADSGAEGLRRALHSRYDLVILDLVMPDLDGRQVLRRLLAGHPEQAVIVLSCVADVAAKVDCLERGAQDYLTKPFSLAELLARVRVQLRGDAHGHLDARQHGETAPALKSRAGDLARRADQTRTSGDAHAHGAPRPHSAPRPNAAARPNGAPGLNGAAHRNSATHPNGASGQNGGPGLNGAARPNGAPGPNGAAPANGAAGPNGAAPANGAALAHSATHPHGELIRAGHLTLDVGRLVADIGSGPVPLTRLEFLLLRELAEHVGQSVPKGTLLATVWGYDFDPGSNVVDVCIRRLRSKLGFDLIKTVRGEGYQLVAQ